MADWRDSLSDAEVNALYKYKTQGKDSLSDDEVNLVYPYKDKIKQQASAPVTPEQPTTPTAPVLPQQVHSTGMPPLSTVSPEQSGKALTGLGEAGVGMLAGMPAQIAGGLKGLGTYLSGQGIDKAAQQIEDIQKSNFGAGAYVAPSPEGKAASEKLGEAFAAPGQVAEAAGNLVGPKTAFAAKTLTDMGMNFLPLHGTVKGAKVLAKPGEAPAPTPEPVKGKTGNAILDALDATLPEKPAVDPQMEQFKNAAIDKQQAAILEQHIQGQNPILVDSRGTAFPTEDGGIDTTGQRNPYTVGGDEALKSQQAEASSQFNPADMPPTPAKYAGDTGRANYAQEVIDARNKAHDDNAVALENNRKALEEQQANRAAQNNMDSSPSTEAQAHIDQIKAEQDHQAHIEETHANALDEQKRLEDAQAAVEARQKAIEQSMSGVKSQWDGIRQLTAEKMPKNDLLDFEAEVRRQMDQAPTKSKAQVQREVAAKAEADRQRIVEQRAANEEMIQKMRDQHTESLIREKKAQADAHEAMAKRDEANTAGVTKAAKQAAKLRAEAEALAKDKAKRDKALANIAKQHALQEIAHPAGSKERAAAVKAVKERFAKKDSGSLFGADKEGIVNLNSGAAIHKSVRDLLEKGLLKHLGDSLQGVKVYRAIADGEDPNGPRKPGQWVTPDKDLATNVYAKGDASKVVSDYLPKRDLYEAHPGGLVYAPAGTDVSGVIRYPGKTFGDMLAEGRRPNNKQSGSFNYGEIGKGVTEGLEKLRNSIRPLADPKIAAADYVKNSLPAALKSETAVGKPISPDDVIARATAKGSTDIPLNPDATMRIPFTQKTFRYGGISESVQSGLNMAALKFKENPVLRGVQGFLNNGLARTNYQINTVVTPLIKMLNKLTPEEVVTHDGVLQREQLSGKSFTDDQLKAAGMNDKQLSAYKMQRYAYDTAYQLQNEALKRLGEKELSREDYYYSSRWTGDYHTPVTKDRIGPDGKPVIDPETNQPKQDLVWYIRTTSRAENLKALSYLKDKYPELNIDEKTQPKYMGNNRNPNAPHDVAGAYRDMMGFFKDDPETSAAIKQAMESYTTAKGYSNLGQSKHFKDKAGIRGFQGDTPWNTPEESAAAGTKAQVDYLKNAIRWSNLQDTVANAKQVLSDPKVMEQHPNAVSLAQHVLNRELGLDTNIVAPIENMVAQFTGQSRNSVLRFVGDVKGMTYLQTLGLNPMYSLATPLQFMLTGPMMHTVMSMKGGYKTGAIGAVKTMALGMTDATAGIMAHMAHEMGTDTVEGMVKKTGMSKIGAEALKYMEDSGYIKRNIFDESRQVGQHGFMDKTQAALGWTIGKPEQVARMMSMMSFVHHLDASGAFKGDNLALFHEAENYSDRALSSFKSYDRPLMVDKLGAVGQAGYVYQSFKFQNYHILNAAFRMLGEGNPMPIATLMGAYALGTGLMNMPGMQEMDGLVNFGKDMISHFKPNLYTPEIRDFDLRDQILNHLPDTKIFRQMSAKSIATNGLAGEVTGLGVAPHASPQILDTEHLANNVPGALWAQEAKEWASVGSMIMHPNTSSVTEAIYKNMPGAKGPMEEYLPNIKQGNTPGNQVFINPNNMNAPKTMPYTRNLDDEAARKINAVSTRETNMKQNWYRSGQEDMRIKNALQGNIDGLLGAYHRNNTGDLMDYAKAYLKLDPEGSRLDEAINAGIPAQYMSQEQQRIAKANKLIAVQSIMRYRNMAK